MDQVIGSLTEHSSSQGGGGSGVVMMMIVFTCVVLCCLVIYQIKETDSIRQPWVHTLIVRLGGYKAGFERVR